jgi:hypothetical protein
MTERHGIIRVIYLYLFALVGLFIFVFSSVSGIGAVLDRYVFPQEFVDYTVTPPVPMGEVAKPIAQPSTGDSAKNLEEQKKNFEKQQSNDFRRRVNQAVPGIVVGYFLWMFHWKQIKKDREG